MAFSRAGLDDPLSGGRGALGQVSRHDVVSCPDREGVMHHLELWPLLTVLLCGFMVGFAKAGFAGFSLLNTPLLAAVVSPTFAVGVALPMYIVGDLVTGWRFFGQWDRRIVLTMLPGCFVGVLIGTPMLAQLSAHEALFNRGIGVLAITFAIAQLVLERRRRELADVPPAPAWAGMAAGVATGITSTIAHQGGVVSTIYLISQHLTKERFAATAMGVYLSLNVMKLVPYLAQHKINAVTMPYSMSGMPFVAAGVLIGAKLLQKLDPKQFAGLVLWLVIATGIKLIVWP